jgi:tetratricopeptide (TPR) repeat protein
MKQFFLFLIIAFYSSIATAHADWFSTPDPLIVVTLMVKDEAPVMQATLQPFLDAGIDTYLILDTGSTDSTVAVTRQLFLEHGIEHGHIVEQPFVDFSTSRNYAIECAEEKFPRAAFILMLDAEWYMHNVQGLIEFCKMHYRIPITTFLVHICYANLNLYAQRLFRSHMGVRFEGVVHEALNQISFIRAPEDIYFEFRPTRQGKEKSQCRWVRDRDLLLKEYEKNPNNVRTLFYLGQTYACLGDWENACVWYKKRCDLNGWDEESFSAHYNLAQAYDALGDWDHAEYYYLQAASMRPTRAEPLVQLAQHYWNVSHYELCFLYAQRAIEVAYPHNDILFVEKTLYDCTRFDLLGRAAWHLGKFELGEKAILQALEKFPDEPHLHFNLALYLDRK